MDMLVTVVRAINLALATGFLLACSILLKQHVYRFGTVWLAMVYAAHITLFSAYALLAVDLSVMPLLPQAWVEVWPAAVRTHSLLTWFTYTGVLASGRGALL